MRRYEAAGDVVTLECQPLAGAWAGLLPVGCRPQRVRLLRCLIRRAYGSTRPNLAEALDTVVPLKDGANRLKP